MRDSLNFHRLSDTTFYYRINTIHLFIKPFLDKKCLFLRNIQPLRSLLLKDIILKFLKGFGMHESKHEITKVVSLVQIPENLPTPFNGLFCPNI